MNWKPESVFTAFVMMLLALFAIEPAFAQTTVDMRPVIHESLQYIATTLITVLSVLGGFAIRFVSSRTGLANSELEASLMARLNEIIHKGIEYAYINAVNEVNKPGSGLAAVKFDNWFMSLAASYVNQGAPGIIKKFGLSQERIQDMIMARLPAYLSQVPVQGGLPTPPTAKDVSRELNISQGTTTGAVGTGETVTKITESEPAVSTPSVTLNKPDSA